MRAAPAAWLRTTALVVGLGLSLGYFAWQVLERHGPQEFAYAPFAVEPMPYAVMRGFTYEQLWGHVRRIVLLGPGILLITWGLVERVRVQAPRDLRRVVWLSCGASLLLTAVLMLLVLRGRAIFDDELAYAMQGTFFGQGRLTGPDLGLDPNDFFNVMTPRGYTVKYLPGEPLVQVLGVKLGVPALMHLPVLALTLWGWHRTLRSSAGERIAALGTAALACSPMLMFTTATGLSHATGLMCVVLLGCGVELAREGRLQAGAALGGASFGAGMLTRPQSMLPVGVVLGTALLLVLWRKKSVRGLLALLVTAGAGVACLLFYDHMLTGSAFKLPWSQQCDTVHFGFGKIWAMSTYQHTFGKGLENLGVVLLRLNSWWLGLPLSLAVFVAYFALQAQLPGARLWLLTGLAVVAFEFCYYSPGVSDTGAIYHYELLLPGSLTAAAVADALLRRFPGWGPLALTLGLTLGTSSWIIEQGLRVERMVSLIHHDSDLALAKLSPPALLIHERLENETQRRGWVFSSFPRRFRGTGEPIVTLPRITADIVARAKRAYPGRACWYFHYRPGTTVPELLRCEDAASLLARPAIDKDMDFRSVYWERPTAYFESDYEPFSAIYARRVRGPDGRPLMPCCQVRGLEQLGISGDPADVSHCVETGDP